MAYTEKWQTNPTADAAINFTFPYIKESDVKVELNGTTLSNTGTTKYSQQTTSITLLGTYFTGNNALTASDVVRVYRDTDSDNLSSTFYPGSAIRSSDLNDNFTQSLYSSQESVESAKDAIRATDAFIATTSDEGATWVTAGNNTNSSTDPKGVGYAVTKSEAADVKSDTAVATADDAEDKADAAVATANAADAIADAAKLATDTYVHDGTSLKGDGQGGNPQGVKYAVDQAVAAVASATTANNTANAADTIADNAKLATDRLVGTTSNNGSTWTVTGNNTNASTDPKGLGYAITTADDAADDATTAKNDAAAAVNTAGNAVTTADAVEDTVEKYVADSNGLKGAGTTHGQTPDTDPRGVAYAVTTATNAAASVAASAIYNIVSNFAGLPALNSLSEDKFYQVNDSTLIQNESTVTGEPAGFIGDDELAVKLKSNITASPKRWDWQEYYATDPETRYRKKLIVENLITISETYTIGTGNNAHSVGPVTISHNGTDLTYNAENHAQPYVALNAATAGNTVTIPENSTWLIN